MTASMCLLGTCLALSGDISQTAWRSSNSPYL